MVALELVRNRPDHVQQLMEQARQQSGLLYCAVVGRDGRYLAHSESDRIGQVAEEPVGDASQEENLQVLRYHDDAVGSVDEYRVALQSRGAASGDLRVAVVEPAVQSILRACLDYAPMILILPSLVLVAGGIALQRLLRPVDTIDAQLRGLAGQPTVSAEHLEQIPSRSATSLGWNRLVDSFRTLQERTEMPTTNADRSQQQWLNVLESFPDGVAVTDARNGLVFCNQAFCALFGLPGVPDDTRLLPLLESRGSDHDAIARLFDDSANQRLTVVTITVPGDRCLRIARQGIIDGAGQPSMGSLWVVRDVTQQALAEKMRDQFLDSASHELRTPLANIRAFAETLALNDVIDVEQQKEFCNTITAEAARLGRFVEDLLNISSLEAGSLTLQRQRTESDRLIREAAAKVAGLVEEKGLRFDLVLADKLPEVQWDKDKISTALVNLLGNAAKYTEPGGSIELRATHDEQAVVIQVTDTGLGIAEHELSRIFDKFYRSDDDRVRKQSGTGLGLSLSRQIVVMHGGTLTAESTLGEGSTFTIRLPVRPH